jgi:hypothetical protein
LNEEEAMVREPDVRGAISGGPAAALYLREGRRRRFVIGGVAASAVTVLIYGIGWVALERWGMAEVLKFGGPPPLNYLLTGVATVVIIVALVSFVFVSALMVVSSLCRIGWGTIRGVARLLGYRRPEPARSRRVLPWPTRGNEEPADEFWSHEPVVAWRQWHWEDGMLHGVWVAWPHSELTATCDACPQVPGWDHTCGVYARKERSSLPGMGVIGRVELSGLVLEHEAGYRAERATITELWLPFYVPEAVVRARYPDVVIHVRTDLTEGEVGYKRGRDE